MDWVAVFVDAGHLFAQGGKAIAGRTPKRTFIALNAPVAIQSLKDLALERAPGCQLLRIYWYDGTAYGSRPSASQSQIAALDDVKLRLGYVNSQGEQKGVDSLIVTDLIELARLKSISDAVLLSGDEDMRIGVQIAQSYGVLVHLLGLDDRSGQGPQLRAEADTKTDWSRDDLSRFLTVEDEAATEREAIAKVSASTTPDATESQKLGELAETLAARLDASQAAALKVFWRDGNQGVPPEHDRELLVGGRGVLGRSELDADERGLLRKTFQKAVQKRA